MQSAWKLYYEISAARVESQRIQHQDMEAKSQRFTAVSGVLTGLLLTFLTPLKVVQGWVYVPAIVIAVSLLASAVCTLLVMKTRQLSVGPRLNDLKSEISNNGSKDHLGTHIFMYAGSEMHLASSQNERVLERKVRFLFWNTIATLSLLVASLPLIATAFLSHISS